MTLSNADLLVHLEEQLQFIDSSCSQYDAGSMSEAKRLATHVRVLLHDTATSTSLLRHLGLKDTMQLVEGVPELFHELAREQ